MRKNGTREERRASGRVVRRIRAEYATPDGMEDDCKGWFGKECRRLNKHEADNMLRMSRNEQPAFAETPS